jgi:hypothetical protein
MLDADGVATTNVAVLAHLESLQTAVLAGDSAAAGIARAGIESQLFAIYYQCTLRYALKLDQANIASTDFAKYQGEGWAFYKTISPIVVAADAAGAATVNTLYTVTGARPAGVRNYCSVKAVLDGCWPAGMVAADFGTLEGVPDGHCAYTPTNDMSASIEVSASGVAAAIQDQLDLDPPNFVQARILYVASDSKLQALALEVHTNDEDYETFKAYFGGADAFHNSYLLKCFDDVLWSGDEKTLAKVE